MKALTAERAVGELLSAPDSHTRAALVAAGVNPDQAIHLLESGLTPTQWPHVTIFKVPMQGRNSTGTPRLARSKFKVVATTRSDKGGKYLSLEAIDEAIGKDLAGTFKETTSGKVWRSHFGTPIKRDYERNGVTIYELGHEIVYLNN